MDFVIDKKTDGKYRKPGIGDAWYATLDVFDEIAGLPTSITAQKDKVTISDTHTFLQVTEGFRKIYSTDDTRSYERNDIGDDRDSRGCEVFANIFFPGSKEEMDAFLLDDPDLIVLIKDFPCDTGRVFQIGSACSPAKVVGAYKSGTLKDGTKGYDITVKAYQQGNIYYTGVITEPQAE